MTPFLLAVVALLLVIAVLGRLSLICWNCGAIGTVTRGKARFCRVCDSFRGLV